MRAHLLIGLMILLRTQEPPLVYEVDRVRVFPFAIDYAFVISAGAALSLILWLFARREWRNILLHAFIPSVALETTGLTIGVLTGNSLTSVAGIALSGFLTIYGGLVIYLFGKEAKMTWTRIAAAIGLTFVAAGIVYGASIGSAFRYSHQRRDTAWQEQMERDRKRFEAQLSVWEYEQKKHSDFVADSLRSVGTIKR